MWLLYIPGEQLLIQLIETSGIRVNQSRPAVGVNSAPEYADITTEVNRIVIDSS